MITTITRDILVVLHALAHEIESVAMFLLVKHRFVETQANWDRLAGNCKDNRLQD
jgi:hypothetical protein